MWLRVIVFLACFGAALGQDSFWVAQVGHGTDPAGNFISTSFSFVNLSNTTNRVEVRSFDADGAPLALLRQEASPFAAAQSSEIVGVELAPRGFEGLSSLNETPSAPGGIEAGWVRVTSERPVAVEVLFSIFNGQTGVLVTSTSVLPTTPRDRASVVAIASRVPRVNTGIALLNPPENSAPATVEVELFDRLGRPVATQEIALQPGQRLASFLNQIVDGLTEFSGTFEIRSDLPVVILPLRQEGLELTTQEVHPGRP